MHELTQQAMTQTLVSCSFSKACFLRESCPAQVADCSIRPCSMPRAASCSLHDHVHAIATYTAPVKPRLVFRRQATLGACRRPTTSLKPVLTPFRHTCRTPLLHRLMSNRTSRAYRRVGTQVYVL